MKSSSCVSSFGKHFSEFLTSTCYITKKLSPILYIYIDLTQKRVCVSVSLCATILTVLVFTMTKMRGGSETHINAIYKDYLELTRKNTYN